MLDIKEDFNEGPLIVLFGSEGRPKGQFWEWRRSTEGLNRIFFCDTKNLWYVDHIDTIVEHLKPLKPRKLLGVSSAGYAALLIGHLIGVKSITFAPQTILEDKRFDKIEKARERAEYPDLSFIDGDHDIYFCDKVKEDVFHAERLDVNLYPVDCKKHNAAGVVLPLRNRLGLFE